MSAGPVPAMLIGAWTETFPAWRPLVLHQRAQIVVLDAGMGPARITRPEWAGPVAGEFAHLRAEGTLSAEAAMEAGPGGAMLHPPAFCELDRVTLAYSQVIARALERLQRGLHQLGAQLGPPADFADYALRVAQILKIRQFARWDPGTSPGGHPDGGLPVAWEELNDSAGTVTPLTAAGAAAHARDQVAAFTARAREAAQRVQENHHG